MGFSIRIAWMVGWLFLTLSAVVWSWNAEGHYVTLLVLVLAVVLEIAWLVHYLNHGNRELARFLNAVQHGDFSQSFKNSGQYPGFEQLAAEFEGVLARLRSERSDKEYQAAYLQAFVQQLPIAVFSLHEDGRITLANQACLQLLGVKELNHVRDLQTVSERFADVLASLVPRTEQSLQVRRLSSQLDLRLSCTVLRSKGQQQKVVSLLDIKSALESREMEAWHNLIRVMTHEIMNSITPLTSLADTAGNVLTDAREQLARDAGNAGTLLLLDDVAHATSTISKRGQGLLRFVESYRQLTKLPPPQPRPFLVKELGQRVLALVQEQARSKQVQLQLACTPEELRLHADQDLLEQALLNLFTNALDAVQGHANAVIRLQAEYGERKQVLIMVTDNGSGIAPELLDSIFIPFFTTKRGGSGIGLSLVKQIVQANGGNIAVNSITGTGTTFTLSFR
jgi:nitrogen fixation/metabolism regulation signal transduction histidine kinase